MADRIVIMKDGHIQQVGTPSEVYHSPANTFVAQFIGAPAMNMIPGVVTAGGAIRLETGGVIEAGLTAHADRSVILGVRPEDLTDAAPAQFLDGTVAVREPLGHETLIYVTTKSGEFVAKADGRHPPDVGATVRLGADLQNLHMFDAATGATLA